MKVDRIDFIRLGDGWRVTKLHNDGARWIVIESVVHGTYGEGAFDVQGALAWLRERGWAVREWPGGARAWRGGKPIPIRTREQIITLRRAWERYGAPEGVALVNVDLAYDL